MLAFHRQPRTNVDAIQETRRGLAEIELVASEDRRRGAPREEKLQPWARRVCGLIRPERGREASLTNWPQTRVSRSRAGCLPRPRKQGIAICRSARNAVAQPPEEAPSDSTLPDFAVLISGLALACAFAGAALVLTGIALVLDERRRGSRLAHAFGRAREEENEVGSDLRATKPRRPAGVGNEASAQDTDSWLAPWRARQPRLRARALARSETMLPPTAPFLAFVGAVLFFLVAAGLAVANEALASSQRTSRPSAVISYVDVGQGDGVVMRIGKKIIVSDAGELNPESVDKELRRLGATRIDVAILTHPHKDHVKNFLDLLDIYKWKIATAVLSHSAHWETTKNNRLLIQTLGARHVKLLYATAGNHFSWGGASWTILSPPATRKTSRRPTLRSSTC